MPNHSAALANASLMPLHIPAKNSTTTEKMSRITSQAAEKMAVTPSHISLTPLEIRLPSPVKNPTMTSMMPLTISMMPLMISVMVSMVPEINSEMDSPCSIHSSVKKSKTPDTISEISSAASAIQSMMLSAPSKIASTSGGVSPLSSPNRASFSLPKASMTGSKASVTFDHAVSIFSLNSSLDSIRCLKAATSPATAATARAMPAMRPPDKSFPAVEPIEPALADSVFPRLPMASLMVSGRFLMDSFRSEKLKLEIVFLRSSK